MTGNKLLIGCPVKNREWILPTWYEYVSDSARHQDVEFLFVAEPSDDDTVKLAESYGDVVLIDDAGFNLEHGWGNKDRLRHMADIRNILLSEVRSREPDLFLSLDSDMLVTQPMVQCLKSTLMANDADAVGGFAFMDPRDPNTTSFGLRSKNQNFKRVAHPGVHEVDYIMAIKMMKPSAYGIDYVYHPRGEDIGWCDAVRKEGLTLFCDGRNIAKHVMRKKMLDEVDPRVGF